MNVQELVRKCLAKCEGMKRDTWDTAQNLFVSELMRRRKDNELCREAFKAASRYLIRKDAHTTRQRAFNGALRPSKPPKVEDARGLHMAIELEIEVQLMEYPLRGGLTLRHATRDDLRDEIEWHRTERLAHSVKERFLESVQKRLPGNKAVEDVLTEATLKKLAAKAKLS